MSCDVNIRHQQCYIILDDSYLMSHFVTIMFFQAKLLATFLQKVIPCIFWQMEFEIFRIAGKLNVRPK